MRTKTYVLSSAVATLSLLPFLVPADAAVVVFSDRDVFSQALDSSPSLVKTVEAWDTYAPDTIFPNGTTVNGITYNVSFGQAIVLNTGVNLTSPNLLFETPGPGFQPLHDTYTFGFPNPIVAFGITFSSTVAVNNGDYLLTTNLGDVVSSFFDPLYPGSPIGQFAGFISDTPFTSVTVSSTANALYGMDNLVYGRTRAAALPEPSMLSLLGMLLGVIMVTTRNRRRSS
jgi:hypothetical protein